MGSSLFAVLVFSFLSLTHAENGNENLKYDHHDENILQFIGDRKEKLDSASLNSKQNLSRSQRFSLILQKKLDLMKTTNNEKETVSLDTKDKEKSTVPKMEQLNETNLNILRDQSFEAFQDIRNHSSFLINEGGSAKLEGFNTQPQVGVTHQFLKAKCEKYSVNYQYFCVNNTPRSTNKEGIKGFCMEYEKNCLEKQGDESLLIDKEKHELSPTSSAAPKSPFASSGGIRGDKGLIADENENDEETDLKVLDTNQKPTKIEISIYCDDYAKHYLYYCLLPIKKSSVLRARLLIFCPSYEKICNNRSRETGAPTDPRVQSNDPFVVFQELKDPNKAAEKLREKRPPVPCTPDCDQRIWPHCTVECKCDYAYPAVQNFCNPPPIPLFLQTCRLWYEFCPKYKQFHYASQFIHSKANKGKVLPGLIDNRPHHDQTVATMPIQREPPMPKDETFGNRWNDDDSDRGIKKMPSMNDKLWYQTFDHSPTSSIDQNQKQNYESVINSKTSQQSTPWDQIVKQIKDKQSKDQVNPKMQYPQQSKRSKDNPLSRADLPDFDFGQDMHRFDQFSDERGLVHQAKTKSPFTKPGLWEANPDNPHNRDHANKFYYAPSSYTADWLAGQLAWGGHWAVPAAGVGGTNGFATVHFPSIGTFLGIDDDYD